ncbi:MAG: M20/M25/M40 family metallo-hydrolase [Anaerolineae bacterium]|nr:M20/M25/M40 family metallo-hydrolase [Anaerolineae bacterium]
MTHNVFRSLLRDLTAIPGISGHEDAIARELAERLRPHVDDVQIDSMANVIARRGAADAPRKVAILAHIDTIGMMVKRVISDGVLGVITIGGINLKSIAGSHVRVGDLPGVVGVRSQHQAQAGDVAVNSMDDLYIYVGTSTAVEITTPITYAPNPLELPGDLFVSPYLDNRAGVAVLIEAARRLPADLPFTVYFVGTAQEETTAFGAYTALQAIQPDYALFIDGTVSYDTPESKGKGSVMLGFGTVLTSFLYISGLHGWHAHPKLRGYLKQAASAHQIAFQQDAVHGLMADSRVVSWTGTPGAALGLPMRGKHSPTEMVHLADLDNAVRLIHAALTYSWPDLKRG